MDSRLILRRALDVCHRATQESGGEEMVLCDLSVDICFISSRFAAATKQLARYAQASGAHWCHRTRCRNRLTARAMASLDRQDA